MQDDDVTPRQIAVSGGAHLCARLAATTHDVAVPPPQALPQTPAPRRGVPARRPAHA